MSTADPIARLMAQLPDPPNPARAIPLARIAQALIERYSRTGAGARSATADLDAAITALDESYGYLQFGTPARGKVAVQLGHLLSVRHTVHLSGVRDRDTGIHVLEEGLGSRGIAPMMAAWAQLQLGTLYLARVTELLRSQDFLQKAIYGSGAPSGTADIDRAVQLFKSIVDGKTGSPDLIRSAEALLEMADVMQDVLRGLSARPISFDFGGLMRAMEKAQPLS